VQNANRSIKVKGFWNVSILPLEIKTTFSILG